MTDDDFDELVGSVGEAVVLREFFLGHCDVMDVDTGDSGQAILLRANPDTDHEYGLIIPAPAFAVALAQALLGAFLETITPKET